MIEMRWYSSDNKPRTLQYRVYHDHATYALPAGVPKPTGHEDMRWSVWRDVPEVHEAPAYRSPHTPPSNQCPRCGIEFAGPMGYVCTTADCPTGLGGSKC